MQKRDSLNFGCQSLWPHHCKGVRPLLLVAWPQKFWARLRGGVDLLTGVNISPLPRLPSAAEQTVSSSRCVFLCGCRARHCSGTVTGGWEVSVGLQQLEKVWAPLADVRCSSHFINVGNKTPNYSDPSSTLWLTAGVCCVSQKCFAVWEPQRGSEKQDFRTKREPG